MKFLRDLSYSLIVAWLASTGVSADEPGTPEPLAPEIAPASKEGRESLASFQKPTELEGVLFAAEPMLANPVAFDVDGHGRVFVCETFRQKKGIEDNRGHSEWLDEDLAAQSVEDRLAYINRHLKEQAVEYTLQDDQIRLLEDTDGDGRADSSTVFADHFNTILSGTGAGVLSYRGNVYYTCIPDLWRLRDTNGDGRADERTSLHYGYGVRFAFRGHDMHGLIIGPDGKLYYSIGDRGFNVKTADGRHLVNPESGAVLRCNLDGSDLEVVATGLRNPQELAFDDYGNLFTGDNSSDSGDKARLVYVVEGGDSGWRMAYQYLSDRGPFNREQIWHPFHAGQPAYIVPPVANVSDGPSGLAYYPGTGLGDQYKGRFFLCDFRGGPANSGIRSFRVQPNDAFFELVEPKQPFWKILATDVAFGPDGSVYISDWVDGWDGSGKGRIYRFFDPAKAADPTVQEVKRLLAGDMSALSSEELAKLLAHPDRRVRQEAQFALAAAGDAKTLADVAHHSDHQLARIHALWGLGQIGRGRAGLLDVLEVALTLLEDPDAEIRAQAAKLAGDARAVTAVASLIERLSDDNPRVRFFAAMSLSKLGDAAAIPAVLEMLAENLDQEPIVRHGGIMALARLGNDRSLAEAARHPAASARMGVLVAMRKRESPQVAQFLYDAEPLLVDEAARAIHDVPIDKALPELAALIERPSQSEPLLRRVLNANYRLGGEDHAAAIAAYAARHDAPEAMRLEALEMLGAWAAPSSRDRVLGMWRPLEPRDKQLAVNALRTALPGVLSGPDPVRNKGAQVAAKLGLKEAGPALLGVLNDSMQAGETRADALIALAALKVDGLADATNAALTDENATVRAAARDVLARINPSAALPTLETAIDKGELVERQAALATLVQMRRADATAVIARALDKLITGQIPLDTQLDVLEAAAQLPSPEIAQRLKDYEASLPGDDPLAPYRLALAGGNAELGRTIFFEKTEVSCVRCHKIDGTGGEVGPDLSKIALEKNRDYLLESIVLPNKTIAKDFDAVMLATDDGKIHTGIVKSENDETIQIITAEAKLETIDKETIEERRAAKSPMPEDLLTHLSKRELRDLIEYLAQRKAMKIDDEPAEPEE